MLEGLALVPALLPVARVLSDDFIEPSILQRLANVVVVCYVEDWGFVVVVPFHFVLGGCISGASVPVFVVPFKVFQ